MGAFFELYKIKKSELTQEEQESIVLDQNSEDLAFDTSLDNEETVALYKMQRHHAGRFILTQLFNGKGYSGPYNTSMFLSSEFMNEIIQAMENSDVWIMDKDKKNVVSSLKEALQEVDFDTEYLFYTYF